MSPALANHLWQSTLFAGVVWLLTLALRRNRAAVRYWLWLAASVKFLAPVALLVAIGSSVSWRTETALPQVPVVIEEVSQPFAQATPVRVPAEPKRGRAADVLPIMWACGFLAILTRWGHRWTRIHADVGAARPMNLDFPIRVRASASLREPGVFGVLRPVLLLPVGISEKLTPEQMQAILAHELCHVRRRDNLTATVHMLVEAMFWFHPLVWWIRVKLIEERERASDEEVLRMGSDPRVYARGILKVCEFYLESPLECVAGVSGSNLKKRIEEIMMHRITANLDFGKKLLLAGAALLALAGPLVVGIVNAPSVRAQSAAAVAMPKFEVAAIRPCVPAPPGGRGDGGGRTDGDRVSSGRLNLCRPVLFFIDLAYVTFAKGDRDLLDFVPITGGPAWINSDHYNINAKAEGNPSPQMMQGPMLQALLEERFKLKIRYETRGEPVYTLTVAKGGAKLQQAKECTPIDRAKPLEPVRPGQKQYCGSPRRSGIISRGGSNITFDSHGVNLDEFSKSLASILGRPVVNKTAITGEFDFDLEFLPDESAAGIRLHLPPSDGADAPSIFTALQEQLGLKLDSTRGLGEFLVIDHVERPSEN